MTDGPKEKEHTISLGRPDLAEMANQLIDATAAEAELKRLTGTENHVTSLDQVKGQQELWYIVDRNKFGKLFGKCQNPPFGLKLDVEGFEEGALRAQAAIKLMQGLLSARWTLDQSIAKTSAMRTSYRFSFIKL